MNAQDVRIAASELVRDFHVPEKERYAMAQAICKLAKAHAEHNRGSFAYRRTA